MLRALEAAFPAVGMLFFAVLTYEFARVPPVNLQLVALGAVPMLYFACVLVVILRRRRDHGGSDGGGGGGGGGSFDGDGGGGDGGGGD